MVTIVNASNRYIAQLTFRGCGQLTDDGIHTLADNWHARGMMDCLDARLQGHLNQNLIRLDLSKCVQLTDASCESIAKFARLLSLNLSDCSRMGDDGLLHVLNGCKYLEEIQLANLHRLQDEGMSYIIRNLMIMKRLRIMGEFQ